MLGFKTTYHCFCKKSQFFIVQSKLIDFANIMKQVLIVLQFNSIHDTANLNSNFHFDFLNLIC